jgi:hypothetical protein
MQAQQIADTGRVESSNSCAEQALSFSQGAYYLITGAWPLMSMRTFESVTGRKKDRWLAKTVGVLVGVVGAALILAARHRKLSEEAQLLGAASAAGLAAIDLTYVAKGRIAPTIRARCLGRDRASQGLGLCGGSKVRVPSTTPAARASGSIRFNAEAKPS